MDMQGGETAAVQKYHDRAQYLEAIAEVRRLNGVLAKRAKRRRRRESRDWLKDNTGRTVEEWIYVVEALVAKHSVLSSEEGAPQRTHIYAVYSDLIDYVRQAANRVQAKSGGTFDHVIFANMAMAWIVTCWSIAVLQAKAFNPKYMPEERRGMFLTARRWRRQLADHVLVQPEIRGPWSNQVWEHPFSVSEKNGRS